MTVDKEKAIRAIVKSNVETYATTFSERHISELHNENGTINSKIHNVFISALGPEIQYYSALVRSLDSSLGNMLETMAINIATLNYEVTQHVEGILYGEQTKYIAKILEEYKRHAKTPLIKDYEGITNYSNEKDKITKRHESDYCLIDSETGMHYLIELKIGGDLDNKKARSEKEALLEQYCILTNTLGSEDKVKIYFATAYNRYGEGNIWNQSRVLQFFSKEELLISADFWNMICKTEEGYNIVIDEYKKNANLIITALNKIKKAYLPDSNRKIK